MAKITNYTRRKIAGCTGAWLKGCVGWLVKTKGGCCHLKFDTDAENDYCVCVGWHDCGAKGEKGPDDDGYRVAWKIGRQSVRNVMQCDLDIDFEMPYNPETGDVDDTLHVLDPLPKTKRDWEREATLARKAARRIWREWAEEEEDEA